MSKRSSEQFELMEIWKFLNSDKNSAARIGSGSMQNGSVACNYLGEDQTELYDQQGNSAGWFGRPPGEGPVIVFDGGGNRTFPIRMGGATKRLVLTGGSYELTFEVE